jgi:hypothetical protein
MGLTTRRFSPVMQYSRPLIAIITSQQELLRGQAAELLPVLRGLMDAEPVSNREEANLHPPGGLMPDLGALCLVHLYASIGSVLGCGARPCSVLKRGLARRRAIVAALAALSCCLRWSMMQTMQRPPQINKKAFLVAGAAAALLAAALLARLLSRRRVLLVDFSVYRAPDRFGLCLFVLRGGCVMYDADGGARVM